MTVLAALSPEHLSEHEPSVQLKEQEPVQVTLQVALVQLMLLLFPTVTSQLVPSAQAALHDAPHVPVQLDLFRHCSEQLSLFALHPFI